MELIIGIKSGGRTFWKSVLISNGQLRPIYRLLG